MPTTAMSQDLLVELGDVIREACENGDNVTAIAKRANVNRPLVSQLRNGTCEKSPTLEKVNSILCVLGKRITIIED